MKEKSVEELKQEIEKLKLQKEKELLMVDTMREKEKLISEIAMLKKAKKKPSAFKKNLIKGLKSTGKGLSFAWKGIQQASRNIEASNPNLPKTKTRKIPKNEIPLWGLP
jgi:hypothetical protein